MSSPANEVGLSKIVTSTIFPYIINWHNIRSLMTYFNTRKSFHTLPAWNGYMSKITVGNFPGKSVLRMRYPGVNL